MIDDDDPTVPEAAIPPGTVGKVGSWTVGTQRDGTRFAVSSRCRHQLADLSRGSLDRNGCLVCPWHGSRYDTSTGAMVEGPKGFLTYVGKTPGYTQMILALGKVARLRRRRVVVRDGRIGVTRG